MSRKNLVQAIRKSLSFARFETFEAAAETQSDGGLSAMGLYEWNAQVSAALFLPLHICEVVTRNAISEALEQVYGSKWPWSEGFVRSLQDPAYGWSPRREIVGARRSYQRASQVIPELKFAFWQDLMTQRHDRRIWGSLLHQIFPNLDTHLEPSHLRQKIYLDLRTLRGLRNRIAHHEPILKRDLADDYGRMVRLVERRCPVTAAWMNRMCEAIPRLIDLRPVPVGN